MKPEIVRLGSLYLNDFPVLPGTSYNNKCLDVGDTEQGMELEWVQYNGTLYGIRCACLNISWDQLNDNGLVHGTLVWIDGKSYWCRSLKVGSGRETPNEWDALLDEFGEDDSLWHWTNRLFWGQEAPEWEDGTMIARAVRGLNFARYWTSVKSCHQLSHLGFRPVLEPITLLEMSDLVVGSNIKVQLPQNGFAEGLLVRYDEYDMVVEVNNAEIPDDGNCTAWQKGQLVINRQSIISIMDK